MAPGGGGAAVLVSALVAVLVALLVTLVIQWRRLAGIRKRLHETRLLLEERGREAGRLSQDDPEGSPAGGRLAEIADRRLFEEQLDLQWRRTARSRLPLTVLLVDVDGLGSGDRIDGIDSRDEGLRQIAAVLAAQLQRPADLLAQLGDGEYAALLAETDGVGGGAVAERMRVTVEGLGITFGSDAERVTISIGVATTVPSPQEQPAALIAGADRALHLAKQAGGNRVAT